MDKLSHNKNSFPFSGGKPQGVHSSFRGHRQGEGIPKPVFSRACIKVLFASSEPHSHSQVLPMVSIGDIRNPARGHQDDPCRRRFSRWSSGSVALDNRTGLELHPGIKPCFSIFKSCGVSFTVMVTIGSSSERFSCFMHFPKPSYKFLSHGNLSLAFILGRFKDAVVHCQVRRVRADKGISGFAQYPSKDRRTLLGDMAVRDLSRAYFGSFSESGIAGNSISRVESVKAGNFGKYDSGGDIRDSRDSFKENDIIPEFIHSAKLKDFPSYNNSLSFKMSNGFKELRERELSHGREFVSVGKEPFLSGGSSDASGSGQVMLHKDPSHFNLNFGHCLADRVPVAAETSKFSGGFIRDKSFGDFVSGEKKGNEFSVDFVSFGMSFAGPVPEFDGVGKNELIDSGFKVVPEPFVHAN